jgi:hypothetical protein
MLSKFSSPGMALPLLQRLLGDALGMNHWTIRMPALVGGIGLLVSIYPLGRRCVGPAAAAVATLLTATSPLLIFYSHFGRAYTLMAWLCLIILVLLQRIVDGARATPARCLGLATVTAALLYVHPIGLGFAARAVAVGLGAGVAAAAALHAPAWQSFVAFGATTQRQYFGSFGVDDVATLVAGSRAGGVALGLALVAALATLLAREPRRSLALIAGCVGPVLGLVVLQPYGDAYAYARYLIPALPAAYLVLGALVVCLTRREAIALTAGFGVAAVLFLAGPRGLRHTPDGPYANTYLGLQPLAAFDVPWDETPAFYRELATDERDLRIVEVPALVTRTRHLYRNYFLQHGKATSLGLLPRELELVPDGPYVSLEASDWQERADADYLILHPRIGDELRRYWHFVYETPAARRQDPAVADLMERQSRYLEAKSTPPPILRRRLEQELGAPVFEDGTIVVWSLETP